LRAFWRAELGWKCVDADGLLETKAGMSIREIFELEGEAGFRLRESELLGEICGGSQQVVATGGGVILDRRNRERLIASGVCVLLEADVATIERRLNEDPASAGRRPALTVGGRAEIESLLATCASHSTWSVLRPDSMWRTARPGKWRKRS